ncbi:MAG: ferritin family protein [Proteobacteria bacterium]|nr:ferritin family protein [Pseudomonadota bacterium]
MSTKSTKKSAKKPVKKSSKPAGKVGVKKAKAVVALKKKAVKRVVAKATAKTPKRAIVKGAAKPAKISSTTDFMVHAYAMETEASERYAEFADSMEVHNNLEVAELFRKLSRIEQRHAEQILEQMGWKQSPASSANYRWEGVEGPETADPTELHYLMQPYHALQIALLNEKRARDFFAHLAKVTKDKGVKAGALEMLEEEEEHVRLIEGWLKRTPEPDPNWEADQDPPVLSD